MITLLNSDTSINYPVSIDASFEYVKRSIQRDLDKVKEYYSSRTFGIKSDHILVRLLYQGLAPLTYDLETYSRAVSSRAPDLSRHFRFGSSISSGRVHTDTFYDNRGKELIIHDDTYVNPYEVQRNWKSYPSVKVLYHNESDFSLTLPIGDYRSSHYGMSVISINISALLIQYREFLLSQTSQFKETNSLLGPTHFLMKYVFPNMLESHLDVCFFNRVVNNSTGRPNSVCYKKLPFVVVDYRDKIDYVLSKTIDRIRQPNLNYEAMLLNIPTFTSNAREAIGLPDIAFTRQVKWTMFVARMNWLDWLITLEPSKLLKNGKHVNELYSLALQMRNEYTIKRELPLEYSIEVEYFINEFIELIK